MQIDVALICPEWMDAVDDAPSLAQHRAEQAVTACITAYPGRKLSEIELSIALADDAKVRELNNQFRGIDKPTNVLAFPAEDESSEGSIMLGDIIVACETVKREAATADKTVSDHLSHLIVHGVLHLFGMDHQDDAEAEQMEACESRILARLGIADPYADPNADRCTDRAFTAS